VKFDKTELLTSFLSRKFLAWAVATVALFMHMISGEAWLIITGAWLGINILQKLIERKSGNGKAQEDSINHIG
jgi:hypothetical protein